jgi:predicted lipoprotein with Yx(FWY)xxD motif
MIATIVVAGIAVAACSSPGASTASQAAPTTAASQPAPSTAASEAPPSVAASQPAAAVTVEAKDVGSIGTVLVAGSNGMTVYVFMSDVKDSGKSACSGGCIVKWPALTVAAGETPSGGAGVTGKLGTITREDDGTLQVTYNGLPLYFYEDDKAPGDANGVYTGWEAVKP